MCKKIFFKESEQTCQNISIGDSISSFPITNKIMNLVKILEYLKQL